MKGEHHEATVCPGLALVFKTFFDISFTTLVLVLSLFLKILNFSIAHCSNRVSLGHP